MRKPHVTCNSVMCLSPCAANVFVQLGATSAAKNMSSFEFYILVLLFNYLRYLRDGAAEAGCTHAFSIGDLMGSRSVSVWGKEEFICFSNTGVHSVTKYQLEGRCCLLFSLAWKYRSRWRNPDSLCYREGEPLG